MLLSKSLDLRPYEVELLGHGRRVITLSWVLLGAGALAVAAAAAACLPAWQQRQALGEQVAALDERLVRLGGGSVQTGPSRPGAGKAGPALALAEAETVDAELHRPWHELFEQIEAADSAEATAVHLLQFSVESPFTNLQLVVEGRDLGELVRFSQRLSGGNPISSMTMTHHEGRDALGAHVITATLQGRLLATAGAATGGGQ